MKDVLKNLPGIRERALTAEAENARLREALEWYREQVRLARLITSEGDAGRCALSKDGGMRAHVALTWSVPKVEHEGE